MRYLNAALVFGTGFILGVFGTAFLLHIPSNSGEWASWAQAVGATVGLAVAIYFPMRERQRHDRETADQRLERAKQQMYELEGIAYKILRDTPRLIGRFDPRNPAQLDVSHLDETLNRVWEAEKSEFSERRRTVLYSMRAHLEDIKDYFGKPQGQPQLDWWNHQQTIWLSRPSMIFENVQNVGAQVAAGNPD
ncbi:hypothetical protein [Paraburkholderia sediminicola]|uniref:hypothetical protein n=1 Tax=Paraburkholderia sediminicola TaxID=458836 RepID=UPI0038BC305A